MKKKICAKCKEKLPISNYSKNKDLKSGPRSYCKKCEVINSTLYSRTKLGLITSMYAAIKYRSSTDKTKPLNFDKAKFTKWIYDQHNFEILFNDWVNSNYNKFLKPSIDRPDDYKGYLFDNIQLMTWGENKKKYELDKINGINNKSNRAVLQYHLDGNLIKEHYSIHSAAREINGSFGNIHCACTGKQKTAYEYIWKFKNNKTHRL